jgi:hypothetical protein
MVPLSHPSLRPEVTVDQIRKYSQKWVDVLNLETRKLESVSYLDLLGEIEYPEIFYALSMEEEQHLSPPLFKGVRTDLHRSCITFDNFIAKTSFVLMMKSALQILERAYGYPVDVEFAWDDGKLYILQCRSQAIRDDTLRVVAPQSVPEDQILFTNNAEASNGVVRNIEYIVYIDPKAYAKIPTFESRIEVARLVGKVNRALQGKRYALFGPVRWGSNDIRQGIKVGYEDINGTLILGEIAFEQHGLTPEVSYGTHFFSDLVEANIMPLAIYPDQPGMIFREDLFLNSMNVLAVLAPDLEPLSTLARVIHVPSSTGGRYLHVYQDGQKQRGIGFFDFPYGGA